MSVSSSGTLRCAERRSLRVVSSANQRSSLIQEALVGVKAGGTAGGAAATFALPLFMGCVVVADQVLVQAAGDGSVDELEEPQELLVAVPSVVLAMTEPLATSRAANRLVVPCRTWSWVIWGGGRGQQRQAGRRPVQSLDLALLIDRKDQRLVRRVPVEADDVADLADELRVGAELPGLGQVRPGAERLPDPRDRRLLGPQRRSRG